MVEFDAVYPFHGDPWELSQSIRLLRKHASGLRNIYVIGDEPGLDVIHIPFIQVDAKELNIWKKTLAACFIQGLSERFLFMNDDHFITKDFEDIANYYSDLPDNISVQYENALNRTAKRFDNFRYFDCHYPIFFEKTKFKEVFMAFNDGQEYVMKSAYCNYHGIEGIKTEDKKLKFLTNTQQIKAFVGDAWCFSTNMLTADLKEYILQL